MVARIVWRADSVRMLEIRIGAWTSDPTFYPSPRLVAGAPPERLAYVASFDPLRRRNDEMTVVDLDTRSPTYRQIDDPIREEPSSMARNLICFHPSQISGAPEKAAFVDLGA